MGEFGALNWTILVVYIVGNLLLGYYLSKRISTADHFFLGDRSTPWWAIGISVVATYVSALSFLGGPSWAYADGFSVIALHANYPIVIFVVITLLSAVLLQQWRCVDLRLPGTSFRPARPCPYFEHLACIADDDLCGDSLRDIAGARVHHGYRCCACNHHRDRSLL